MALSNNRRSATKIALFALCSVPFTQLAAGTLGMGGVDLGANPVETLIEQTGIWTLRLLLVTLLVTPAARVLPGLELARLRRMLGLFAFSYALAHFVCYAVIDQGLALPFILEDVTERPFITVGFTALMLLVPLAVTSNHASMRRLGRHWKSLHGLVYPIALLGCWHFYWQVKADVREPVAYFAVWLLLMVARLPQLRRLRTPRSLSRRIPHEQRRDSRQADALRHEPGMTNPRRAPRPHTSAQPGT